LPDGHPKVKVSNCIQGDLAVGVEQVSPASMAFLHLCVANNGHGGPQANARVVVLVVDVVTVVMVVVLVVLVVIVYV